jgi:predicted nucleic acid-binding Zn ribbon protein
MDLNQERLDSCVVCGHPLPERKARFCSAYCSSRARGWRRDARNPDRVRFIRFIETVSQVVDVDDDPEKQAKAKMLVKAGLVKAYRKDGVIKAIGPKARGRESVVGQSEAGRPERLRQAREAEEAAKREDEILAQKQRASTPLRVESTA